MFGKKDNPSPISPEDHGILNNQKTPKDEVDSLRKKYAASPEAQRIIDIYDASPGRSEYFELFDKYRKAMMAGDQQEADRLYALLQSKY